jgi:hypothetical protein
MAKNRSKSARGSIRVEISASPEPVRTARPEFPSSRRRALALFAAPNRYHRAAVPHSNPDTKTLERDDM